MLGLVVFLDIDMEDINSKKYLSLNVLSIYSFNTLVFLTSQYHTISQYLRRTHNITQYLSHTLLHS